MVLIIVNLSTRSANSSSETLPEETTDYYAGTMGADTYYAPAEAATTPVVETTTQTSQDQTAAATSTPAQTPASTDAPLPSSPDAPPPSQLTWPDTAEMQEAQAVFSPAANNPAIKELADKIEAAVTKMDSAVTSMNNTTREFYTTLFALNDRIDDLVQAAKTATGTATEIFNQTDTLKD